MGPPRDNLQETRRHKETVVAAAATAAVDLWERDKTSAHAGGYRGPVGGPIRHRERKLGIEKERDVASLRSSASIACVSLPIIVMETEGEAWGRQSNAFYP